LRGEEVDREAGDAAIEIALSVIACDKREAFAQGSKVTKQSMSPRAALWIASLRSQ
jgi:hypothetical protein